MLENMVPYRVFVSTDLGGDPDDIQSLYRIIHFSDWCRMEGIASVYGPGSRNSADLIRHWIQRVDVDLLRANGLVNLQTEAELLAGVRQGATTPGAPSADRTTEASRLLIERAHASSDQTLWVLVWGSLTDLAQALHDDPTIAPKIRIYYISSSNTEGDPASREYVFEFMLHQYPKLWWIENGRLPKWSGETFRGVYDGGYQEGIYQNKGFIQDFIRGKGSTHNGLFAEKCGDAFPVAEWPKGILKEGDSPSFLYLLSPILGGVGDVNDPTKESWGGSFRHADQERFQNYYVDKFADMERCKATISKWRRPILESWMTRWLAYAGFPDSLES